MHDLVFASPSEDVASMVKREMETVHRLDVPLIVDVGIGSNWRDAK